MDENDPKVEGFLQRLGIAYEKTASAKEHYIQTFRKEYPEWDDATVARTVAVCIEERRDWQA